MARVLSTSLQARGYEVAVTKSGQDALDRAAGDNPVAVILDLGLPDIDGIDVCRQIRKWSRVPIIVVTADGAEDRKIQALDEGADDYVTKPFSMPELLARLRVALRHRHALGLLLDEDVLSVGDLEIDLADHQVTVSGQRVELTPKEFDVLTMLARHPGKVVTHRSILRNVWGPEAEGRNGYLRTYANYIRKKLGNGPSTPRLVSEPGVGYRLLAPEDD
jgi:two-component system KDP operon response regulator KdpE